MENAEDPRRSTMRVHEKKIDVACGTDEPNRPTSPVDASKNERVSMESSVTGTSANDWD